MQIVGSHGAGRAWVSGCAPLPVAAVALTRVMIILVHIVFRALQEAGQGAGQAPVIAID